MKRPGEFELIAKYFAPLSGNSGFGLMDDAALVDISGRDKLVITQDAIAQSVHFFPDDPAELIAKKAVRVNLSDLAAKGAAGRWVSLSLGLGTDWSEDWVSQFARGLAEDCEQYGLELTGGDTFKTGSGIVVSITMIGELVGPNYVSRLSAEPGDQIYVSGTIGDGALGLLTRSGELVLQQEKHTQFLTQRYLLPQPRVKASAAINRFANASMDISDGLVGDLEKLCNASGLGAELQADAIPLSPAARAAIGERSGFLETVMTGGDDYEILACVSSEVANEFVQAMNSSGVSVTRIGVTKAGKAISVFDSNGKVMDFQRSGFDHSGG